MAAMTGSEYSPEDKQGSEHEGPISEVSPKGPHTAFGTARQEQGEVSADGQGGRRKQHQKVNH